jgi:hypothetical protein
VADSYEPLKIPLAVTLGIRAFTGPDITEFSSFMKNMVAEPIGPEPEQKVIARHRPAFLSSTQNDYASFGYQIVDVGGAKTGASATGLANSATVYTASIAVDGAANAIAITGSTAQTYTNLVAQINSDLTGATAAVYRGNIRVVSDSSGAASTIAITDTDLFSTLTDFSEVSTAVDGSAAPAVSAGRGIYFWEATDALYFVNDNTLFKESYEYVDFLSSGYKRVYFTEIGTTLFIADPENDEAWLLSTSDAVTQVTDADFPTELADGVVTLNGITYVLDPDGYIYASATEDGSDWNALDVLNAERSPDGGIFIGLHHDNIVVGGPRTIEFFSDTGNPVGSPLTRRNDVFYNVGMISGESICQVGDTIFFLGTEAKGSLALYKLENYQLTKISAYGANAYLTNLIYRNADGVYLTPIQAQGKTYVLINAYNVDNSSYEDVYYTFALDADTGMLYWFTSDLPGVGVTNGLQITDWTLRTGNSAALGRGITSTGTIISISDTLVAYDSDASLYIDTDYWVDDYTEGDGETPAVNMPVKIRLGFTDHGTGIYKHPRSLEVLCEHPNTSVNLLISWSKTDSRDASFGTQRVLPLRRKSRIKRTGRYQRISYDIEYNDAEPLRLEALESFVALGER